MQADVGAEAGEVEEEDVQHNVAIAPNLPVTVQKTNRVDVTERFGKFDIRQELERKQSVTQVGFVITLKFPKFLCKPVSVCQVFCSSNRWTAFRSSQFRGRRCLRVVRLACA